ncbi:MAG: 2-amino-4-ketopentanoate thiolase [Spirochaeta sp.]|nr:2-amino-4-ketopentanoate thiolase [Spirochaeta sp.]
MVEKGSWVEIHRVILKPGERAPQVPEDTKAVPLELKVRGFLLSEASLYDQVEISTLSGRILSGKLIEQNPGYSHSFGRPIAELIRIGAEAKALLKGG